jgi:hypothetical protein
MSGRVNPPGRGLTRFSRVVSGQPMTQWVDTFIFFKIFLFIFFLHASGY